MNKLTLLTASVLIASYSHAQLGGKLKGLKDKAKDKTNTSVPTSKYDKHMTAGEKAYNSGDLETAYKEYSAALELKPGDYSAKNMKGQASNALSEQYYDELKGLVDANNCSDAESKLNHASSVMPDWQHIDWYKKEIQKCKDAEAKGSSAKASKEMLDKYRGKAVFKPSYNSGDFKNSFTLDDDIFVHFIFDKTLVEYQEEKKLDKSHSAYVYYTLYVNGEETWISPSHHFASNYSKVWTDFYVALNVDPLVGEKMAKNPDGLSQQDIYMIQLMSNYQSPHLKWLSTVMGSLKPGDYKIKIDMNIGIKDGEHPIGDAISSGEFSLKVTEDGKKKIQDERLPADWKKKFTPVEDKGMTSDIHKKYLNQIVFADKEIEFGTNSDASFSNDFDMNSNVYARVYLDKSITNYYASWGAVDAAKEGATYLIQVYAGDKLISSQRESFDEEPANTWTTVQIAFAPDKSQVGEYPKAPQWGWGESIYALSPGKHKLTVKVLLPAPNIPLTDVDELNEIASGTFTVNVTEAGRSKFAKERARHLPEPYERDAQLEAAMIKATTGKFQGQTPIKAVIAGDWRIKRDWWGNIIKREKAAHIALKYDDGSCRVVTFDFTQDYDGSTYGKTYNSGVMMSMENYILPCENVK